MRMNTLFEKALVNQEPCAFGAGFLIDSECWNQHEIVIDADTTQKRAQNVM